MTAKVAIDLALDRLFDYAVPPELEKKLSVGQLLSVPFGHRLARGFAMELSCEPPKEGIALKCVAAIEEPTPFFTPKLLELARAVAAYSAAPLESVLKAALPAAVVRRNARPKEALFVEPCAGRKPEEAGRLTKRQRWLYEQVVRLGGGWLAGLAQELGCTASVFRALERAGLLSISSRAMRRDPMAGRRYLPSSPLPLNDAQAAALERISAQKAPVLLFGVTGSGKTEVYLQAIARELERGRGAIVMVPEISLTPQTMRRFAQRFGDKVALLHSALSDGERYDEWHRIRRGEARVVVGPRSAVFAPVGNLGLIVVDEEHEPSYKQEELPRYHARDVAVLRGSIEGAKVVLGSATPSLESWMNARRGKYELVEIGRRAGGGTMPNVAVVDVSQGERGIFSRTLLDSIALRLDRREQAILFLNRRGYSRSMTCASCGAPVECPKCSTPYAYHRADSCLRCHICGGWAELPAKCPRCGAGTFDFEGLGIQRAEDALRKCFPSARILRMDSDSVSRRHSHDEILGMFGRGEADILIGTQMIAKGLDFPNVTLVGVLNADASLNQPDFRAAERTFQLLSQVAGRAGRAELPGEVVFQTRDPSVRAVRLAATGEYAAFAEGELKERREWGFPPFCHLALVTLASKSPQTAAGWAEMYSKSLAAYARGRDMKVGEAVPAAIGKADGWYRWQLALRSPRPGLLSSAWRWIRSCRPPPKALRIAFDMDAHSMM